MDEQPYHEGEQAIQGRVGLREKMEGIGRRVIRDRMPDEHREFFAQLPWLLVGSTDSSGRPWASALTGELGFVASPDARTLVVSAYPSPNDMLAANLRITAPLGLLGLELHTRRRNRANGLVTQLADGRIHVSIQQSFGNCPKYINRRCFHRGAPASAAPVITTTLNERQRALITGADTLFIASSHLPPGADARRYGVDVSHRGGAPGFVRIEADGSLAIPDYIGNFAFNTLGNIDRDGRAGLLFIDFAAGDLLQLTADAWIDWDAPEIATVPGVQRLLRVRPHELRLLPGAFPYRAAIIDTAPQLETIGNTSAR